MSDYVADQLATIKRQLTALQRGQVTHRAVQVTASNPGTSTFTVDLPDGQPLSGLASPLEFLPAPGQWVRLRLQGASPIYDPAGIGSMPVTKLTSGTGTFDLVVAGQIATALSGQRSGLNSIGLFAYNASGVKTIDLNGVNNLISGLYKTALTGRRIEMGVSGSVGAIKFIGADGTVSVVDSWTQTSGEEAIRMALSLDSGDWGGWNGLSFQTNDRGYLAAGYMVHLYGGGGAGTQAFEVGQAATHGTTSAGPSWTQRLRIDTGRSRLSGPGDVVGIEVQPAVIRMYLDGSAASIDIIEPDSGASSFSPGIQFRAQGGTSASLIKYVVASGGGSPRTEFRNTDDTAFSAIWASAFTVSSSEAGKEQIADLEAVAAFERLRAMRVRTWRQRQDNGKLSPLRIGLVAEEAPAEVVEGQAEAVNLYSMQGVQVAALQRLIVLVLALTARVGVLERTGGLL